MNFSSEKQEGNSHLDGSFEIAGTDKNMDFQVFFSTLRAAQINLLKSPVIVRK